MYRNGISSSLMHFGMSTDVTIHRMFLLIKMLNKETLKTHFIILKFKKCNKCLTQLNYILCILCIQFIQINQNCSDMQSCRCTTYQCVLGQLWPVADYQCLPWKQEASQDFPTDSAAARQIHISDSVINLSIQAAECQHHREQTVSNC